MLRITIFSTCVLFGIVCNAYDGSDPTSRTLLQVVWDIGVFDKTQAEIERKLGNDPLSLIELPKVTNWTKGLMDSEMSEVAMGVPMWVVKDRSGFRGGAFFSVWCDHGDLYQDTILVEDLREAEGNATVEWAFDGEPFVESIWFQKNKIILPPDNFPHDTFVRRLANARFLVLKIRGHTGLDQPNPRIRPEDTVILPVSLTGTNSDLLELIRNCSLPRSHN